MFKKIFGSVLGASLLIINIFFVSSFGIDESGAKVQWGYQGTLGPAHWGQLDPAFSLCSQGKSQSPIDITHKNNVIANDLVIHTTPEPLTIVNDGITPLTIGKNKLFIKDGHGIQINSTPNIPETITLAGKKYTLVQFHLHTPSENKLQGRAFPLEIHFVYQGDSGRVAVIGVFASVGKENPVLQKIVEHLPQTKNQVQMVRNAYVNPGLLMPATKSYYRFQGSLTTPPCTEGLQWIVMQHPITASTQQIAQLRAAVNDGNNARPSQALNEREINYSK